MERAYARKKENITGTSGEKNQFISKKAQLITSGHSLDYILSCACTKLGGQKSGVKMLSILVFSPIGKSKVAWVILIQDIYHWN